MSTQMIDYDALARQAGAISSVPAPSQSSATAPPAQSNSGDVDYSALAKQNGATSSTPAPQQPGFVSTLGSDIYNMGKGLVSLPGKIYDYATTPQDPAAAQAQENAEEAHKTAVYKQFSNDMHAGNYSKAFSGLADLFDPSYDDQNDPLAQAMTAQWNSSAQAKDAMVAAAKKGDTLGVVQHAAGVLPIASQVDAAMTNYQKDPTRENLAHIVSAAIPAFVPAIAKGVSAAGGAISDAAGDAVDATLRPRLQNVADTDIPVRAQGTVAKVAETVANPSDLKEFEVNQTQPAVRQAAGNIAADVANTEAPTTVPTKADAFGFGQAADEVGARTSAGFQKVDEWSQGKFSDAQDEADTARGSLDYAGKQAYQKAIDNQNELLDQYGAAHPDEDVQSLKDDWKQKIGLDELATRFNRSVGPTPAELTTPGQPDLGYVNPSQFRNSIVDAVQNGEFDKAGFTPEHVQSMDDLGRILEQAKPAKQLNDVLSSAVKHLTKGGPGALIGGAIGHVALPGVGGYIGSAVGGLAGDFLTGKVLGSIMTDTSSLRTLSAGLATGANADLVGQTLASRLKSLWTDESGEMKIPGTGSDAPTHTYDPESGITPTTVSLEDAVDPSKANYIKTRGYIAGKVSGTSADAGDLTQNVMTKLVKNYDNISNKSPQGIGSYLQQAADNEVNDYMRLNPLKRDLGLTEVPPAEGSIGKLSNGRPVYDQYTAKPLPEPGTEGDVPKSDAASDDSTNFNYVKAYKDYLSDHPEDRELLEEIANKTPTNTEGTLVNVNRADLKRAPYEPTFGLTKTDVADLNRQFNMGGPENVKAKLSQIASDIESYIPRKSVPSSVINTFYPGKDYSPTGSYTFPDSLNTESPIGQEGIRYMVDFEDGRGPVSLGTYRTGPTVTSKPFGHGESSPQATPAARINNASLIKGSNSANSLIRALRQVRGTLK